MQKWNNQAAVNGGIPGLSTPAQVSAVLDVLAGGPGSLLVRTSQWQGLASPADATKFLSGTATPSWNRVTDADLSLSDITTNNASSLMHGFVPKLPADATKYYDGTGNFTVPAGGGGGGFFLALPTTPSPGSTDTGAMSTKGNRGTVYDPLTVAGIYVLSQHTIGDTYVGGLARMASALAGANISSIAGVSPTYTELVGGVRWTYYKFATPVALAAGDFIYVYETTLNHGATFNTPMQKVAPYPGAFPMTINFTLEQDYSTVLLAPGAPPATASTNTFSQLIGMMMSIP